MTAYARFRMAVLADCAASSLTASPGLSQSATVCTQVVGQMQTAAGGAQGAPQQSMSIIPGLQALLGQRASAVPGSLPGTTTDARPQGCIMNPHLVPFFCFLWRGYTPFLTLTGWSWLV